MKKFFIIIIINLIACLSVVAQVQSTSSNKESYFDLSEWFTDKATFMSFEKQSKRNRAKSIMSMGKMNEEGAIIWQYVIHPTKESDTINVGRFMQLVKRWKDANIQSAKELYESSEGGEQSPTYKSDKAVIRNEDTVVEYEWSEPYVGYTTGYLSSASISVNPTLKIEVKPNRFRITFMVRHYRMAAVKALSPQVKLYPVGAMYPFTDSQNKETCTQAYINSNVRIFNTLLNLISYLNLNYEKEEIKQKEEEW